MCFICELAYISTSGISGIAAVITAGVSHRWSVRNDDESFFQWCCNCGISVASQ